MVGSYLVDSDFGRQGFSLGFRCEWKHRETDEKDGAHGDRGVSLHRRGAELAVNAGGETGGEKRAARRREASQVVAEGRPGASHAAGEQLGKIDREACEDTQLAGTHDRHHPVGIHG